jgi:voltage-gated potassium channel
MARNQKKNSRLNLHRAFKASARDTFLLLNEFRGPILFFSITVIGIGLLYFFTASAINEPVASLPEAMYLILTLMFFQSSGDFPRHPLLQIFYFIMPLIGIGILARGLADFGILFFNRRARGKEWEMSVASTFHNHTVLVGLGHLGYRVVDKLHSMNQDIVVIDIKPDNNLISLIQNYGIPVIQDDGSRTTSLEAAGIRKAKTIILCMQNDSLNLQIALKARSLNSTIQVIIRIFDEDFAKSLHDQFGFTALSATEMAAPIFAAAAAGMNVSNPISIEGQQLVLAYLTVTKNSVYVGKSVGSIEDKYQINILFVRIDHRSEMHPPDDRRLSSDNIIGIIGSPEQIQQMINDNAK